MTGQPTMLRRAASICLTVGAALLLAACNSGSYRLEIFPEMHYQPSYRPLEPRRLTPPDGAVPSTGAAPNLTYAQARDLANPVARTPESGGRARRIYEINCATCHGQTGDGQGPMAAYYAQSATGVVPPTDLASARVQERTDGELWWIIRQGLGNMPPYGALLADDEVWLMVQLIRETRERR